MKQIKTDNGQIINGYEFADLSEDVQNTVMDEQINFEIEVMQEDSPYWYLVEKMERMQTPWFLGQEIYKYHKQDLIETININGYLFTEDGDMLPLCYHTKGNEVVRMTYGKKEHTAVFI